MSEKNKKKKLILVTDFYPYGFGEKIFLGQELEQLAARYDVTIISSAAYQYVNNGVYDKRFENKVRFVYYERKERQNGVKRFLGAVMAFFSPVFLEETMRILLTGKQIGVRIYSALFFYRQSQKFYKWMRKNNLIYKKEDMLYYTYWNKFYTLALLRKNKQYSNIKIVSRFHGCDLCEEQNRENWQPFKEYMDKRIDKCLFVSQAGMDYYLEKFSCPKSIKRGKYEVCRLGVKNRGRRNPGGKGEVFCLVSCAMIIPLKRVELIVKALSCIKQEKVEWIHFGSGEETDEEHVKRLAEELLMEKKNIIYKFMGYCDNEEIMKFYEEKHIDCFITTSSTEGGVPVSIQEALSMGIPIIGTDVGGICEGIDGNGILLKDNPEPQEIADSILKLYYMGQNEMKKMREKSYALFQKEYNAEENAKRVVGILEEL